MYLNALHKTKIHVFNKHINLYFGHVKIGTLFKQNEKQIQPNSVKTKWRIAYGRTRLWN